MTIRLYLDEDSSDTDLLKALRLRAVDVVSTVEVGTLGQSDEEQLAWAAENQRVVYSSNRRDFYRIHSEWMRDGRSISVSFWATSNATPSASKRIACCV